MTASTSMLPLFGIEVDDDLLGLVLLLIEPGGQPVRPIGERSRVGSRSHDLPRPLRVVIGYGDLRAQETYLRVIGEGPPGLLEGHRAAVIIALLDDLPEPILVEAGLDLGELRWHQAPGREDVPLDRLQPAHRAVIILLLGESEYRGAGQERVGGLPDGLVVEDADDLVPLPAPDEVRCQGFHPGDDRRLFEVGRQVFGSEERRPAEAPGQSLELGGRARIGPRIEKPAIVSLAAFRGDGGKEPVEADRRRRAGRSNAGPEIGLVERLAEAPADDRTFLYEESGEPDFRRQRKTLEGPRSPRRIDLQLERRVRGSRRVPVQRQRWPPRRQGESCRRIAGLDFPESDRVPGPPGAIGDPGARPSRRPGRPGPPRRAGPLRGGPPTRRQRRPRSSGRPPGRRRRGQRRRRMSPSESPRQVERSRRPPPRPAPSPGPAGAPERSACRGGKAG